MIKQTGAQDGHICNRVIAKRRGEHTPYHLYPERFGRLPVCSQFIITPESCASLINNGELELSCPLKWPAIIKHMPLKANQHWDSIAQRLKPKKQNKQTEICF
jgi:hypothetical protein